MKQKTSDRLKTVGGVVGVLSLLVLSYLWYNTTVVDPAKCLYGPSFWCSSDAAWKNCVADKTGGDKVDRKKYCGTPTVFVKP